MIKAIMRGALAALRYILICFAISLGLILATLAGWKMLGVI